MRGFGVVDCFQSLQESAMKKQSMSLILTTGFLIFFAAGHRIFADTDQISEDELKQIAPRIFLDCQRCDRDYVRTEIDWINYVRDRKEADVHILGTVQRTGSDGWEYTFEFIGNNEFSDITHTMKYVSSRTDTWDEIRKGYVDVLKRGLLPFIIRTPLAQYITFGFEKMFNPTSVKDKWNFWVFNIGVSGSVSGEKSQDFQSIRGNVSANRVTPELKVRVGMSGNFNESHFDIDGDSITSTSERKNVSGMVVKSINDHWGVGGWMNWRSSTYNNLKSEFVTTPAVEYNFFPYAESTRRQLRCLYRIGYSFSRYIEETIYEKMSENLIEQALSVTFELKEPWGIASTYIEGSHYFHDLSKNKLELGGYLSLRLIKGLSLSLSGGYARIHDQLSLPKEGASLDEILLRRKELETDYGYHISLGFNYTFGSVYSNVVNPRFGH
jgi:hypothetical protein